MNRSILINNLIKKYNFKYYLEIGISNGKNFNSITCENKESVDPAEFPYEFATPTFKMTSDNFFNFIPSDKNWDIIFIDGLHHTEQVDRDIVNSLNHLSENGFIILHDCNPVTYESQIVPRQSKVWNGDVWKSIVKFRKNNKEYGCIVLDYDNGLGIISKLIPVENIEANKIDYHAMIKNKKYYLGLTLSYEFI